VCAWIRFDGERGDLEGRGPPGGCPSEGAGGIGTWDWDLKTDMIYANERFARPFRVDSSVVPEMPDSIRSKVIITSPTSSALGFTEA
jgi:hypothetical protein